VLRLKFVKFVSGPAVPRTQLGGSRYSHISSGQLGRVMALPFPTRSTTAAGPHSPAAHSLPLWSVLLRCWEFLPRDAVVHSAVLRLHVVRLSVHSSVTLVDHDHIGWKSWKLIARSIRPTPSLYVAKRPSTYSQGNMGKFGGDYRWGRIKWRAGAQKRQYLGNA